MAKKPTPKASPEPIPEEIHPQNATEYVRRGWLYYSQGKYEHAEADFSAALESRPEDVDTHYALGLTLKNRGQQQSAIQVFEKVIELAENIEDRVRSRMVIRLAKGHIQEMVHGDWNLENEIWQNKS
ncbi:MAG TPA: tetratricopeptide repeat protein [Anaerolineaceae bacterium]|nr:tetratricopeptide repeat protein [Anaerolineaceae bacterium]